MTHVVSHVSRYIPGDVARVSPHLTGRGGFIAVRGILALGALLIAAGTSLAQAPAVADLLRRVPDEMGVCLAFNDVKGFNERLGKTTWFAKLQDNPLVKHVLDGREVRNLVRFEDDLKKYLQVDFATLRDEILGDAVVFAYQPEVKGDQPAPERGILLVKAPKAETLSNLIEKFNELQTNAGELTSLEERKHKDHTYYRRVHQRATHFYYHKGAFLAIASQEDLIRAMLDRETAKESPRREQWLKAEMAKTVASLWVNPRIFEAELAAQTAAKDGPERVLLQSVLAFWKGLDAVVVGGFMGGEGDGDLELRMSLVARPGSSAAKLWNEPKGTPSDLWRRFPANALIAAAAPIDIEGTLKRTLDVLPERDAGNIRLLLNKNLQAATGMDVSREILPNLGPDIGFAILPPVGDGPGLPRLVAALRAKPAPKEAPVDQMLLKAANLFIGLSVFEHNRKSQDIIKVRSVQQGDVDVKFLTQDKLFPPGFQPSLAIKDSYLIAASSPDAVAAFGTGAAASVGDETPYVKIAPREVAKALARNRQVLVDHLVEKNRETPAGAGVAVDGLASGFDLFQSLTLSQRSGGGQSAWILRLSPK